MEQEGLRLYRPSLIELGSFYLNIHSNYKKSLKSAEELSHPLHVIMKPSFLVECFKGIGSVILGNIKNTDSSFLLRTDHIVAVIKTVASTSPLSGCYDGVRRKRHGQQVFLVEELEKVVNVEPHPEWVGGSEVPHAVGTFS